MSFTVYKSSAGSGKTFTLVKEYLKIVLQNPTKFKHILAITFTNKAASEMKERVMHNLKEIANSNDSSSNTMIDKILEESTLDKQTIKQNANIVLKLILHNYSDFAISTIDSFTHRIIRTFAHDLHIPLNFEIELDSNRLLEESIDLLLAQVGTEPKLTKLLLEFTMHRTEEDKSWHIENDLLNFSKQLMDEEGLQHLEQIKELEIDDFNTIKKNIHAYVKWFENELQSLGKSGIYLINANNINIESFFYGKTGIGVYFKNLSNQKITKPNSRVLETIEKNKWYNDKLNSTEKAAIDAIAGQLAEIYTKIIDFIETHFEQYNLVNLIAKTVYQLAVLKSIQVMIEELKTRQNIVPIAEFNLHIAAIVFNEPVPFIYERLGERFKHFLIDEFQDTSVLQWNNLVPLIDNSLAENNLNIIAGDGKQAIYRWRNGDVDQFANLPAIKNESDNPIVSFREDTLKRFYEEKQLNTNYRSKKEIIEFNNTFFTSVSTLLSNKNKNIYTNNEQLFNPDNTGGYIQIECTDNQLKKEEQNKLHCELTKQYIEECVNDNFKWADIAIICRTNFQGALIANYLTENKINVISAESLLISSSPEVCLLISILTLLNNPADNIPKADIIQYLIKSNRIQTKDIHLDFIDTIHKKGSNIKLFTSFLHRHNYRLPFEVLRSLPLYDVCEQLIQLFKLNTVANPTLLQFMETVFNFSSKYSINQHEFLEYWEKQKSKISIKTPDNTDAVKILTIHKSKGLEFPVVIYPFAFASKKDTKDFIWATDTTSNPSGLQTFLLPTTKTIAETKFAALYQDELDKSLLDSINLLYVTMTRPTDRLYIVTKAVSKLETCDKVQDIIAYYVRTLPEWNETKTTYIIGTKTQRIHKQSGSSLKIIHITQTPSANWQNRIILAPSLPKNKQTERGVLIHSILSQIQTANDINTIFTQTKYSSITDLEEIKNTISNIVKHPLLADCYDGTGKIFNEFEVIQPTGKLHRLDRFVIHNNKLTLIDYKTGKATEQHMKQMHDYAEVFAAMHHNIIKLFLIYVDSGEVLEVE